MDVTATSLRHPLACKKFMMEFKENDKFAPTPIAGQMPPTPSRAATSLKPFELFSRYTAIRPIAKGTYGFVIAARDATLVDAFNALPEEEQIPEEGIERDSFYDQHTLVAIKKVPHLFEQGIPRMWLCAAREAQMLLHFQHENVISAKEVFIPLGQEHLQTADTIKHRSETFEDLYIVMDYKEMTLRDVLVKSILMSEEEPPKPVLDAVTKGHLYPLSKDYRQFILYQLLRGVGYLHACRVMHRDLKPENVLVDLNYRCSICDFGQAKDLSRRDDDEDAPALVSSNDTFVDNCTQWYAAPETITLVQDSTGNSATIEEDVLHSADVWSIGAMAAEMIVGRPIFATHHRGGFAQLPAITSVRGALTPEEVEALCTGRHEGDKDSYRRELTKRGHRGSPAVPKPFKEFLRESCPITDEEVCDDEIDLIDQLLAYDPRQRPTCASAIAHKFFVDSEYDPVIDPENRASVLNTVEKSAVQSAADGRSFFWKLFLKSHPEVEELEAVLNAPKPQSSSAVARGRLILQSPNPNSADDSS
jgi:serine/threonine protein kinase